MINIFGIYLITLGSALCFSVYATSYECGEHGRFEYCIDEIPGCVIGCYCHPGFYFDSDTKKCEPNSGLTSTTTPKNVASKISKEPEPGSDNKDLSQNQSGDVSDWLLDQFMKTIEDQVISKTEAEAEETRRSGKTRKNNNGTRTKDNGGNKKSRKTISVNIPRIGFESASSSSESQMSGEHNHKEFLMIDKKKKKKPDKTVPFYAWPNINFYPNMPYPVPPPSFYPHPPQIYPPVPVPPMMMPLFPPPVFIEVVTVSTTAKPNNSSTTASSSKNETTTINGSSVTTSSPPTTQANSQNTSSTTQTPVTPTTPMEKIPVLHQSTQSPLVSQQQNDPDKIARMNQRLNYYRERKKQQMNNYKQELLKSQNLSMNNDAPSKYSLNNNNNLNDMQFNDENIQFDRLPNRNSEINDLSDLIHKNYLNQNQNPSQIPTLDIMRGNQNQKIGNKDNAMSYVNQQNSPNKQNPQTNNNMNENKDAFYSQLGRDIATLIKKINPNSNILNLANQNHANTPGPPFTQAAIGFSAHGAQDINKIRQVAISPFDSGLPVNGMWDRFSRSLDTESNILKLLEDQVDFATKTVVPLNLSDLEDIISIYSNPEQRKVVSQTYLFPIDADTDTKNVFKDVNIRKKEKYLDSFEMVKTMPTNIWKSRRNTFSIANTPINNPGLHSPIMVYTVKNHKDINNQVANKKAVSKNIYLSNYTPPNNGKHDGNFMSTFFKSSFEE